MSSSYDELSAEAAHTARARFRIVDVREPYEFDGPLGRIEGAELVPLASLQDRLPSRAKGEPLLLVCRTGSRSAAACTELTRNGARDATNLVGGMIAWNQAGLPVVRRRCETQRELLEGLETYVAQATFSSRDAARKEIGDLMREHGATYDEPTPAAIGLTLGGIAKRLEDLDTPPPDLALTLDAFRSDLARW